MTETSANSVGSVQRLEIGEPDVSKGWMTRREVMEAYGYKPAQNAQQHVRVLDGITGPDMHALKAEPTWERINDLRMKLAIASVYGVLMTIGFLIFLMAWGKS